MAAAAASATQISRNCSPISSFLPKTTFIHTTTTSLKRRLRLRLSPLRAQKDHGDEEAPFVSQEDVKYLVQLGAGSVAGAAAVKYGSILLPQITQPNLAQALFMIFAPVIVAVLLLFKQSRLDSDDP